jgi:hypothetical protein
VTGEERAAVERFCRQVAARSCELNGLLPVAPEQQAWIVAGSLLRMQVESATRALFLLNDPPELREWRVERPLSFDGKFVEHPTGNATISDTRMAELADQRVPALGNSLQHMYKLGCRLVHLTSVHEYHDRDPYQDMTVVDRQRLIIEPLRVVWGSGVIDADSTFPEVIGLRDTPRHEEADRTTDPDGHAPTQRQDP